MMRRPVAALAGSGVLTAFALIAPAGAQTPQPCAPGVAPSATIRGYDGEDGGGPLTATHTIGLEAHDRNGPIRDVTFTLPPGAEARGSESDPAFSVDTPGQVPVTATWSHYNDADGSSCTASAQGTLRIRPATALTFIGLRPGTWTSETFGSVVRAGKNADVRPVQLRLRGVRRARLPGRGTRVQTLTLALRRGDRGLSLGRSRKLRAAGWQFFIGFVDEHNIDIRTTLLDNRRGRRGPARGFGYTVQLVQAGERVGRIRVIGRCGYLGCRWRAL
jgi:hypothetical protein